MTKLIMNADDFGYCKGINLGIIECFQNGVVTSATLMANMPGTEHAAALAKENQDLGVGVHLVLTCGRPVRSDVPSLVREDGEFHRIGDMPKCADPMDIEKELNSQMERFLSLGLAPTHIDSHHHVHGLEKVFPVVEKIAKKYGVPVRKLEDSHHEIPDIKSTDRLITDFFGSNLMAGDLIDILDSSLAFETVEIMCHPGYIDEAILTGSSYALPRVKEMSILTDPEIQKAIEARNIQLVSYKELGNRV
ncbi:chitin disaccharide deacetylase [Peribacillus sp. NPDC097675]|uniref:chitin disaccharide deacetylase n=1 Tax=Peribacillus sp. NPDC097675 TaxID=3390618 RepID=UPI003CFE4AB7